MTTTLVSDGVVDGILARLNAPGGYDAFVAQVRAARGCRRPVRLAGRVTAPDPSGVPEVLFDTSTLPDGVLLKACGTRRETLCPPCAALYRGDAFQLVAAGLRGGKGIPDTVGEHPAVLLTLTAPSFGAVHRRQPDGSCHRGGRRCPHGVALVCGAHHAEDDEALGQALCASCYDYAGAVLFNAGVSELWRRTTIYALRSLGTLTGLGVRRVERTLRLSYVKVVEFQRRGSVHLHALVRLDVRGDELGAAPGDIDAAMVAAALQIAARKVTAPLAGDEAGRRIGWGTQTDTVLVADIEHGRRRVAAYLGKYACKGSDDTGALNHRLRAGVPAGLALPRHLRALVGTAWDLGQAPGYSALRLKLWAHTCGFRGHFLTKSRVYSTTFGALRAEREAWRLAQAHGHEADDRKALAADEGVVREWRFEGSGYLSIGDATLAENLAEEVRLGRRLAHETTSVVDDADEMSP